MAEDVNKNLKAKFEYYHVKSTINVLLFLAFAVCSDHLLVCSLDFMNRKLGNHIFHSILYVHVKITFFYLSISLSIFIVCLISSKSMGLTCFTQRK